MQKSPSRLSAGFFCLPALELAPKKAAGTAAGFTGLFGYLGGSVAANALVGYTVDWFGWDGGFTLLLVSCGAAILCIVPTLKHDNEAAKRRMAEAQQ